MSFKVAMDQMIISLLVITDYIFPTHSTEKPENSPQIHKSQTTEIL